MSPRPYRRVRPSLRDLALTSSHSNSTRTSGRRLPQLPPLTLRIAPRVARLGLALASSTVPRLCDPVSSLFISRLTLQDRQDPLLNRGSCASTTITTLSTRFADYIQSLSAGTVSARQVRLPEDQDIALLPITRRTGLASTQSFDSDESEGQGEYKAGNTPVWNWHTPRPPRLGDKMKFG